MKLAFYVEYAISWMLRVTRMGSGDLVLDRKHVGSAIPHAS